MDETTEDPEDFDQRTGVVIVALPAATDPIVAASSEDIAHMTMVWLGDASDLPSHNVDVDALKENLGQWAAKIEGPLVEGVSGSATLGADSASVVLVDATSLAQIRDGMVSEFAEYPTGRLPEEGEDEMSPIHRVHSETEQFPTWLPHVTLGYPETPALAEYAGTEITFDRLALWVGDDRTEFPLGGNAVTASVTPPTPAMPPEPTVPTSPASPPEAPEGSRSEALVDDVVSVPFHGIAAPIGVPTGDKRMFAEGSVTFREMPVGLHFVKESGGGGHAGATSPGRIDKMWIDENNMIQYSGEINPNHPDAGDLIDGIVFGNYRGVSVDTDLVHIVVNNTVYENELEAMDAMINGEMMVFDQVRIAALTVVGIPAFQEGYIALGECDCPDEGAVTDPHIEGEMSPESLVAAGFPADFGVTSNPGTHDGPGWLTDPEDTDRIRRYWTHGKGAAKIGWGVPGDFNRCRSHLGKYVKPEYLAGTCANMHKEAIGVWPGQEDGRRGASLDVERGPLFSLAEPSNSLVASAAWAEDDGYVLPSSADFANPHFTERTPMTITADGRIFGHAAEWGTCHIGVSGVCTTPPSSRTNYAYFLSGIVETTEGPVPTGPITIHTGHAGEVLDAVNAMAHYDNTGTAAADVSMGEDGIGIWFAGRLRDTTTPAQLRELKAAAISGDWRRIRGNLEMVAALAVNTPGYGIPRTSLVASAGVQQSLVASGIVQHDESTSAAAVTDGFVRAVADEVEFRQERRARARAAKEQAAAALRPTRIALAKKGK